MTPSARQTWQALRARLRLPVVAAPMFLVSGPDLVIACGQAGILGSFPLANARNAAQLDDWLARIGACGHPYAVNLIVRHVGTPRYDADMAAIERHRPPVVITSVGQPGDAVARVHAYGGLVFHDVATLRHADKAIASGVDGLILLTAGAGGHCGTANPFAFVPAVRARFDGAILLAGAISDGRAIRAAEVLGADFAYMGTRFAATAESMASPEYKALLVSETMDSIVTTDRMTGMRATFMAASIRRAGLDPDDLPPRAGPLQPALPEGIKAWRDVWSGGHGVSLIDDIPTVADLVDRLEAEYLAGGQGR